MSEDVITEIYNCFHPFVPLPAGDPAYVDCSAVRGDENIFRELGRKIIRSNPATCQVYTGHRGVGKTTELLRLREYLKSKGCFVVYFGATDKDIDEQDAQYTDILLACTRHILEDLKDYSDPKPLLNWLSSRWEELKNLALSEVNFENLQIEAQISLFAKLTARLRATPSTREQIRREVDIHTVSLLEALNEFIDRAKKNLPAGKSKLVVIADNLDRIVPVTRQDGRNNHDEIFIDRSGQLKALDCHVIYTVPISLVYSNRSSEIRDNYDTPQVLPMVKVKDKENNLYQPGIEKFRELIEKRIGGVAAAKNLALDTEIFDSEETRVKLSKMSGGHVREMMLLIQTAIDWIDDLPITASAVQRAITEARNNTYRATVDDEDWIKLAEVYREKRIPNEDEYRDLLFRRCVLEYREATSTGEIERWHDVHPIIVDIAEFQEALQKVETP
ncbi:MAG: ATP-binding protein [Oscillatoria sp. PMC 1051.18]|nr:ATP-binding protein [Oscillatoria sp. PMC 1050.18]MEC5029378.1 ATP-binding protein [Oscillatoria sp. PMC 1051.18]